jgi:hypothetical protein
VSVSIITRQYQKPQEPFNRLVDFSVAEQVSDLEIVVHLNKIYKYLRERPYVQVVTSAGDPKITEGSILTGSWVLKILKLGFCKAVPREKHGPRYQR